MINNNKKSDILEFLLLFIIDFSALKREKTDWRIECYNRVDSWSY